MTSRYFPRIIERPMRALAPAAAHARSLRALPLAPRALSASALAHKTSDDAPGDAPGDALVYSHAATSKFEGGGLRSFFEYRDLGISAATNGAVAAHVIRGKPGLKNGGYPKGAPHKHSTTFQMVYVLKGWVEFQYEGQEDPVRLEAGSCVYQPPSIRHQELGHSPDVEMLEIVMPGNFGTQDVQSAT